MLLLTLYLKRRPRRAGPHASVDDYRPSSPYVPYVPPPEALEARGSACSAAGSSSGMRRGGGGTINTALLASPGAPPRGHSALPYPPADAQAYNQRLDTLIRDVQSTD